MKALIVTNHYIDRNSGGSMGTRSTVNILSEIIPGCFFIYPGSGNDATPFMNKNVIAVPCPDSLPKWMKGMLVYFGRLHRFKRTVIDLLNKENFDLIFFDTVVVSHKIINYARKKGIKIITIHHGAERDFYKDNKPPLLIRIPFMIYIGIAEEAAVTISDLNLVPTKLDKERLLIRYKGKINKERIQIFSVYENSGLNPAHSIKPAGMKNKPEINFIITGSLSFPQSDICIRDFLEKYLHVIGSKISNFKVLIAGSNPRDKLIRMADSANEVLIIRNPENMDGLLKDSDIYLCPVSMGSGIKLRIMDGLKYGLPVIAHEDSVNGYETFVENGIMFSYNSPQSFSEALDRVLEGNINPDDIIKLYKNSFSYEAGKNRMRTLLTEYLVRE
jgi:glycosyltransferase involved in cell wall biosynthesis